MKKQLLKILIGCFFMLALSTQAQQSFTFVSEGTTFKLDNTTKNLGNITIFPEVNGTDKLTTIEKDVSYTIVANTTYTVTGNFTKLTLKNNKLKSLDVSKLVKLEELEFQTNNITSLDVSSLTNLKLLAVSANKIESLDVSKLTNLEELYCEKNPFLTSLNISELKKLITFWCHENQLIDIKNDNSVVPTKESKLTAQKITIQMQSDGKGGFISVNTYSSLEKDHKLEGLPKDMTFEGGKFKCTTIPSKEVDFTTNIGWDKNKISGKLKFESPKSFTFISEGTTFKLDNTTKNLGNITISPGVNGTAKLTTIEKNKSYTIVANTTYTVTGHFTKLALKNNKLKSLDVSKLVKLEELEFQTNNITSLDVSSLTNLKLLAVSANKIESLDVSKLTNLEELYCEKNPFLTSLNISELKKLITFWCHENQLIDIKNDNSVVPTKESKLTAQKITIQMQSDGKGGFISVKTYSSLEKDHKLEGLPKDMTFEGGKFKCTTIPSKEVDFTTNIGWDKNKISGKLKFESPKSFTFISEGTTFKLDNTTKNLGNITISPGVNGTDKLTTIEKNKSYTIVANTTYTVTGHFTKLALKNNKLKSLDVSKLLELEELEFQTNNIKSLDVSSLKNLKHLAISANKIESLDVSKLTNLEKLYCEKNPFLTSLNISGLKKLTDFWCNENQLIDIKNANSVVPTKESKLTAQKITIQMQSDGKGGFISVKTYSSLEKDHKLEGLPKDMTFEGGKFKCTNIPSKEVDFTTNIGWDKNKISGKLKFESPKSFTFISEGTTFKLDNTTKNLGNITISPGVNGTAKLTTIEKDKSYTILANTTYTVTGHFTKLALKNNKLKSLDVSKLVELEELQLQTNNIKSLDVSSLKNLKLLAISTNKITSLDVSKLTNLEELYCEKNPFLTSLNVSGLKKLEIFWCNENQLIDIKNANSVVPTKESKLTDQKITIQMQSDGKGGFISVNTYPSLEKDHKLEGLPKDMTFEGGKFKCTTIPSKEVDFTTNIGWDKNKISGKLKFESPKSFTFISEGTTFKLDNTTKNLGNITISPGVNGTAKLTTIEKNKSYTIVANTTYTVTGHFTKLALKNNKLKSLDVSKLVELEELQFQTNNIKSLDVSSLKNLKHLAISANKIESLDVSKLTNLEKLYCEKNSFLTSLNISGLKKLTDFWCNENQLIDIKNANSVVPTKESKLTAQKITIQMQSDGKGGFISVKTYSSLEKDHKLEGLPKDMTFEGGKFKCTTIPSKEVDFTTNIGWDKNKISGKLKFESPKSFTFISEGTTFKLDNTTENLGNITISPGVNGTDKLTTIEKNKSYTIVANTTYTVTGHFTKLALKNNKLKSLDVSKLVELEELQLQTNNIKSLDVSSLKNLKLLAVSANKITSLDVSKLTNLEELYCEKNPFLTSLNVSGLKKLEIFWCYENQLIDIKSVNSVVPTKESKLTDQKITIQMQSDGKGGFISVNTYPSLEKDHKLEGLPKDMTFEGGKFKCTTIPSKEVDFTTNIGWDKNKISGKLKFEKATAGIEDFKANFQLRVYPNPVVNELQVVSEETILEISIYDINGRLLINKTVNDTHITLPTSELNSGMHILRVKTDKGFKNVKIIKE